ncbi:Uncharacterised protein [Vibrio cholerae]|uniref:Uncharacterized protein n=1 Tax=Vibrio cholerae TaxID=666 RepID=A0A655PWQ7_VIBCL|nr:Uncharacterised protein [Vibrio cholerae]CSA31915.1 Uncharacterised protein [Vibrio cholerae]
MLHLRHIFGWGEQKEDRVQIALLWDDVVLTQEVGQYGGRNTKVLVFAGFWVNPRCGEQELTRVNEILTMFVTFKRMPFLTRFKFKETQIIGNLLGGVRLPRFTLDHWWNERLDVFAFFHQ